MRLFLAVLSLAFALSASPPSPAHAAEPNANPVPTFSDADRELLHEFGKFRANPPWLDGAPGCGKEPTATLDDDSVCASTTPEEQIAWLAGASRDCRGAAAVKWLARYGAVLKQREDTRIRLYAAVLAAGPETQAYAHLIWTYPQDERMDAASRALFLTDLRRHVEAYPQFTSVENVILYQYFQTGHMRINPVLRQHPRAAACLAPLVARMKSILAKRPRHEGIVWRGLSLSPDELRAYRAGETIQWDAFSSTSMDRGVARNFMVARDGKTPVLLQIASRNCIDVWGVSDKFELEVLCLPGTRLRSLGPDAAGVIHLEEI